MTKRFSVVVPTRDRPEALARCRDAIAAQLGPDDELVIAEDAEREGAAATRNRGIEQAQGRVVVLCDDDCVPIPGWLDVLGSAASGGPAAGRTVNAAPGGPAEAAQVITNHLQLSSLDRPGMLGFAPTCNLAAPRELFLSHPFDERYGHAGGEDRDWCDRVQAAGHTIRYVPEALVEHRHQLGIGGLLRQQFRYGRGAARYLREPGRRPAPALGFVRAGFRQGAGVGALVVASQLAAAAGVAVESLASRD